MILAPLRGVTIRCFRLTFAREIASAGFTEAVTPFITATPGFDPLRDRELRGGERIMTTPQFISKDPSALRECLERIKGAGYQTADLNAGCPFPMVRNKGRGSGLLKTPETLRRLLSVGCETMGPGRFSLKTRLGVDTPGELLALMPLINEFPLRFLAVHARTARQMYEGDCDLAAFRNVAAASKVPVVYNGDAPLSGAAFEPPVADVMVGRPFVRSLGLRDDSTALLGRYIAATSEELSGDRPVLGRIKELVSYWKDLPPWRRRWSLVKLARSIEELQLAIRD
ncbi:MAG: tRNA-dihydrouridine synthase family protein [Kiritimatiellae bacterium]|nr:tRNA-dihydrouridine synthase family protein [Kiritimatiellia bacterium]